MDSGTITAIASVFTAGGIGVLVAKEAISGWKKWRAETKRREALASRVRCLPDEMLDVLRHFHDQGSHTIAGDWYYAPIRGLERMGYVTFGEQTDMVNSYITVVPAIWDVLPLVFGEDITGKR